jgi:hypothetical protein
MGRPDALPDARGLAAPFPLPDLHRVDAIPPAPHASDASAAVLLDAAADAALPPHPALADVPCAEKLVVPAPDALAPLVPAPTAEALPPHLLPADA